MAVRSPPARLIRAVGLAPAPVSVLLAEDVIRDNAPLARRPGAVQLGAIPCGSLASELQSPSAAAGLRREFSPARPPGLGGGHCALGLADAVAHEPCGGSPVQGHKG